jgi:hypothetical protein
MLGSLNVEKMYLWEYRLVFEAGGAIAGDGDHETPTEIEKNMGRANIGRNRRQRRSQDMRTRHEGGK